MDCLKTENHFFLLLFFRHLLSMYTIYVSKYGLMAENYNKGETKKVKKKL